LASGCCHSAEHPNSLAACLAAAVVVDEAAGADDDAVVVVVAAAVVVAASLTCSYSHSVASQTYSLDSDFALLPLVALPKDYSGASFAVAVVVVAAEPVGTGRGCLAVQISVDHRREHSCLELVPRMAYYGLVVPPWKVQDCYSLERQAGKVAKMSADWEQ